MAHYTLVLWSITALVGFHILTLGIGIQLYAVGHKHVKLDSVALVFARPSTEKIMVASGALLILVGLFWGLSALVVNLDFLEPSKEGILAFLLVGLGLGTIVSSFFFSALAAPVLKRGERRISSPARAGSSGESHLREVRP